MNDPEVAGLEAMFARTEPVCVAWVRREEALEYARRAAGDALVVALIEWRVACVEYVDAVIAASLERAAADRVPSGCTSVWHDAVSCRDGLLPVSGWCDACLASAPVALTNRRLYVVPDLVTEGASV